MLQVVFADYEGTSSQTALQRAPQQSINTQGTAGEALHTELSQMQLQDSQQQQQQQQNQQPMIQPQRWNVMFCKWQPRCSGKLRAQAVIAHTGDASAIVWNLEPGTAGTLTAPHGACKVFKDVDMYMQGLLVLVTVMELDPCDVINTKWEKLPYGIGSNTIVFPKPGTLSLIDHLILTRRDMPVMQLLSGPRSCLVLPGCVGSALHPQFQAPLIQVLELPSAFSSGKGTQLVCWVVQSRWWWVGQDRAWRPCRTPSCTPLLLAGWGRAK